MPRRRSIATREQDAQAVELRRRHLNYPQIAAQLGMASKSSAYEAVQRGLADMAQEPAAEVRQMELDRLDDIARGFQRIFATRHYAARRGRCNPCRPLPSPSPDRTFTERMKRRTNRG